ncbi:hypothetical protein [Lacticaseibacillus rhamnosus]|nr:hypothetical protein [Lacticaseibacillus rhamnosus]MDE3301553.1 hypothetical protein [Lacticaseibacillus rhamnosus]DAH92727.1 MAG TPA: hypothetical protein [Caudoviricetes sp.]DAM77693.1 MAG TPA: hypothetical protein [Caudoviricetes sp.]
MMEIHLSTTVHSVEKLKELLSQLAALQTPSDIILTCDLIFDAGDRSSLE